MARSVSPPSYQVNVLPGEMRNCSGRFLCPHYNNWPQVAPGLAEGNQIIKTNTRQEHHSGGQSGQVGQEGWELEFYSNPELARPAISHCHRCPPYVIILSMHGSV